MKGRRWWHFRSEILHLIKETGCFHRTRNGEHRTNQVPELFFAECKVYVTQFIRDNFIEQHPARCGLDHFFDHFVAFFLLNAHIDLGVQCYVAAVIGNFLPPRERKRSCLHLLSVTHLGEVVDTENHVL